MKNTAIAKPSLIFKLMRNLFLILLTNYATTAKKTKVKGASKLSFAQVQISLAIQVRNQYLHVITVEIIKTKIGSE
jgi:hypothetical protein